jgi:hypothetical protein
MPIEINKELKHLEKLKEDINELVVLYCLTPLLILEKAIISKE